ncbi:MAG: hypothetical protein UU80_C0038G0002 [candidate division WWE3 bacterium GW2011_GWA1_41_8]|uniref:Uncharacterized protein n=1 Tax=candidate division WWE3 bacterium GW2011_GWA1_41_8 TaxID=1619103 RepID=A0A0G0X7L1_UNCKA|nr:MAG: hypothetical protein UU80_C0038G0002 [candidate division WWE3 bacterium GW2011_GWA1_41_8]
MTSGSEYLAKLAEDQQRISQQNRRIGTGSLGGAFGGVLVFILTLIFLPRTGNELADDLLTLILASFLAGFLWWNAGHQSAVWVFKKTDREITRFVPFSVGLTGVIGFAVCVTYWLITKVAFTLIRWTLRKIADFFLWLRGKE